MKTDKALIIKTVQTDISTLTGDEIISMAKDVAKGINLAKLEREIIAVIKKLSAVGEPTWNADIDYIVMDSQQRLDLIFKLTSNLEMVKGWTTNIRRNKDECTDNADGMYAMLNYTQDLIKTIFEYGQFKQKELQDIQTTLADNKQIFLK